MNSPPPTTHPFAAGAISRGVNHVLSRESWAPAELSHHAPKTIMLQLPFGTLVFQIEPSGLLKAIPAITSPSLTLIVPSKALMDMLGGRGGLREQAIKAVKISGDADLAQLLARLTGQLRWEYEEDLSHLLGDAPAHFAVKQSKKVFSASKLAVNDLLENLVEYASEEKKVLLNKRDFARRRAELNELRDAVDRLEKRIQLLEQKAL